MTKDATFTKDGLRFDLTIPGKPIAQPRARVTRFGAYTPKDHPIHDYKNYVAYEWQQLKMPKLEQPLHVVLTFMLPRPQRLIWKNRPMPRVRHDGKPDLDNLCKSVFDSLEDIGAFRNDSQICRLDAAKFYAAGHEEPHTLITVVEIA